VARGAARRRHVSTRVRGLAVTQGIAQGRAVLVQHSGANVARYRIEEAQVESELERLRRARDAVAQELHGMQATLPGDAPVELAALIDVHLQLLHDEVFRAAIAHWITQHRYNAEWALSAQMEILARQFDAMDDTYLRERKADLEQVVERVQHHLHGVAQPAKSPEDGERRILVAHDLSPADLLRYRDGAFAGFVTDAGAVTSHTAIVARSMGIPAVVAARGVSQRVRPDDWLVVDGEAGIIIVEPDADERLEYQARECALAQRRKELENLSAVPARTLDGEAVQLLANIEGPEDVAAALRAGATGVGLFRSEFLFMERRGGLPSEEEQFQAYRAVVEGMHGLPVTIRTIDVGADKPLDGANRSITVNPALGLRAIRWSLADPAMFRTQLRAILRAAAHGPVSVLFPMIGHLGEIHQVLSQLQTARDELAMRGVAAGAVRAGAMVEVPAAALLAEDFLQYFDFLSIGTNDLIQYTLAIDRADESVAYLYDPLHPAILRLVHGVIAAGARCGKEVSICGEMAADAALTRLLLGLGLRYFSMQPTQIPHVKQQVLLSDAASLKEWAGQVVAAQVPRLLLGAAPS